MRSLWYISLCIPNSRPDSLPFSAFLWHVCLCLCQHRLSALFLNFSAIYRGLVTRVKQCLKVWHVTRLIVESHCKVDKWRRWGFYAFKNDLTSCNAHVSCTAIWFCPGLKQAKILCLKIVILSEEKRFTSFSYDTPLPLDIKKKMCLHNVEMLFIVFPFSSIGYDNMSAIQYNGSDQRMQWRNLTQL